MGKKHCQRGLEDKKFKILNMKLLLYSSLTVVFPINLFNIINEDI